VQLDTDMASKPLRFIHSPFIQHLKTKSRNMKTKIVTLFIFSLYSYLSFSQKPSIDYNKFVQETQKNASGPGKVNIVWWIPIEFWDITLHNNKSLSDDQIKKFIDELKPYSIFAVVDADVGALGGFTYNSVDNIRNSIVLIDNDKKSYKPLEYKNLDPNIQNLLSTLKPILKNAMGQLGENMNFFVFTDKKSNNKRVSDPYLKGNVQINIKDKIYKWRTPLGSLLPMKICPKDGEAMNGAWDYCPWDGEKLVDKK
jgi:hypothetical protein